MDLRKLSVILAIVSGVLGGRLAAAAAADSDAPGVARLSLIEGQVSYFRSDGDDWTGVDVNAPLVTGDRVFAGAESRAEVQLAGGVYARLGDDTELDLVELGPSVTHVQVPLGRAILRVRRDPESQHLEIDTPAVALVVKRRGAYRVEVEIGGRTVVRVHEGELVAHAGADTYTVGAGSEAVVEGVGDEATWRTVSYTGSDDFDSWEQAREARVAKAESYRYVSEDIYGAEDLDEHGDWEYRRGYGHVWRPYGVGPDWGPYSTGRWVWCDPWGWTWLDAAAWGWAPFHYGRWVYLDTSWYWAPGPIIASPIYAPALVGWYGYGFSAGFSVGFGFGPALGWVALGWGEPCFPWWGGFGGIRIGAPWWGGWGGPHIVNNVFVDNRQFITINARDVNFVNRGVRGGFSTVPVRDFTSGRGGRIPIGGSVRDAYTPIEGRIPIGPSRDSRDAVAPTRRGIAAGARPPEEVSRRQIARAPGREGVAGRSPLGSRSTALDSADDARGVARRAQPGSRGVAEGDGRAAIGARERDVDSSRSLIARGPRAPRSEETSGDGREGHPFVARRPVGGSSDERAGIARGGRSDSSGRASILSRGETSGRTEPSGRTGREGGREWFGRSESGTRAGESSRRAMIDRAPGTAQPPSSGSSSRSAIESSRSRSRVDSPRAPAGRADPRRAPRSYSRAAPSEGRTYGAPRGDTTRSYGAPRGGNGRSYSAPSRGSAGGSRSPLGSGSGGSFSVPRSAPRPAPAPAQRDSGAARQSIGSSSFGQAPSQGSGMDSYGRQAGSGSFGSGRSLSPSGVGGGGAWGGGGFGGGQAGGGRQALGSSRGGMSFGR